MFPSHFHSGKDKLPLYREKQNVSQVSWKDTEEEMRHVISQDICSCSEPRPLKAARGREKGLR
jgi:hypothetical protein